MLYRIKAKPAIAAAPTPAIFPLTFAAPVKVEAGTWGTVEDGLTEVEGFAVVAGAVLAGIMLVQPWPTEYDTVVGMPQVELPLL